MRILDKLKDLIDRYNTWNEDREKYVPVNYPSVRRPWGYHKNKD